MMVKQRYDNDERPMAAAGNEVPAVKFIGSSSSNNTNATSLYKSKQSSYAAAVTNKAI